MKLFLPILSVALLISLGAETTQAQNTFADFEAEGVTQGFVVVVKNAGGYNKQRQYFVTLSIAKNGAISGRAVRYHFEPKSPSASPSDGERLTVKAGTSKLGQPIVAYKTYFPGVPAVDAMRCPFYIELSDGAIIRGIVKINGITKPRIEGTIEAPFGPVSFMGSVLSLHD